jgi:hypothetical protein
MESASLTRKTEDLGRRLLEQARRDHGAGAKVERVLLVASVTEENGAQRAVVVSADSLKLYEQAGTLRHALRALTAPKVAMSPSE